MWHRRRDLSRVKKQIRNYGLVRTLASHQYPELRAPTHTAVALFPPIVIAAFAFFFWGLANGGLAWPNFWDISLSTVPMGLTKVRSSHITNTYSDIQSNCLVWVMERKLTK